ncbi:MAG: hypothetical protein C0503_05400 [Gemmatimonas sp.]|nr:hypothetical protein [Gemmatimonas sp.]
MHEPTPPGRPEPLPPIVAWVSRHSGWLIFLTILTVALLEGVGIYHIKRRANERVSEPAPASVRE